MEVSKDQQIMFEGTFQQQAVSYLRAWRKELHLVSCGYAHNKQDKLEAAPNEVRRSFFYCAVV